MASRTQIRLGQVTGSAVNIKTEAQQYVSPTTVADMTGSDLQDLLGALAASVQRIHGASSDEVFNNTAGTFTTKVFDVDTNGGAATIDATGTSNFTTHGALTISGSDSLSLASDGGEIDITARQGLIDINATAGAIDLDAGTTVSIDGASGINIGTNADVAIDIDASTLDIDASDAVTIDGVGTSNFTVNGALTISGSTGLNLKNDSGTLDIENRQGAIDIDAVAGKLLLDGAGGIDIGVASDVAIDMNSSTLDIDASGAITIDSTSTFSIDGVGASNVTTVGALTISGSASLSLGADSGEIDITARQGDIDINATAGGIDIDAGAASAFNTSAGKITIAGAGGEDIGTSGQTTTFKGAVNIDEDFSIDQDMSVAGDVTITGDLTVSGDTVQLDVTNKSIEDRLIILNSGSAADPGNNDAGIIFAQPDVSRALFVDQSDSRIFKFANTYSSGSANSVDITLGLADVALKQLYFHDKGGESITGDGTDLTLASGGDIALTATAQVQIPASIPLTFDGTAADDKISSDGTDLTIAAGGGAIILDANTDITLDANGADVFLKDDGSTFGTITNSSNTLILSGGAAGGDLSLEANSGIINVTAVGGNLAGTLEANMDKGNFILSGSTGNNLILGSNDTIVRFEIKQDNILTIQQDTGEAILSSSAGRQLVFNSNDGKVAIKGLNPTGASALMFEVDAGSVHPAPTAAKFYVDGFQLQTLEGDSGNESLTISGSKGLIIDGGASSAVIQFNERDANGSNSVKLQGPASTADLTLTLPSSVTNDYFLKTDGSGNLSFASPAGNASKAVKILTASANAGSVVKFGTGHVKHGTSAISSLAVTADQGPALDVFVNGQLMLSGSEAERAASPATCDFAITAAGNALKFAFKLEVDDIIQVIKR